MDESLTSHNIPLDDALDLNKLTKTGSVLHINILYDEGECLLETDNVKDYQSNDCLGSPVTNFEELAKQMTSVNSEGTVKKKVLEEGGGLPLQDGNTVSIIYTGFWENDLKPFDVQLPNKPLVVDLNNNGLLPGMLMAVKSMLVGEVSMFMFSYKVMYGELGVPPRIKPKSNCVFYIKVIKSIITPPNDGEIDFSKPNMYQKVSHKVKLLYSSGVTLHKAGNINAAIQLFRKGVFMLYKCRLADETEEKLMEKLLTKLYINLAICYNTSKQPLKACVMCNELNRLNILWKNGKALYQHAKALRMIGQFNDAEKRLKRAMKLCPDVEEIEKELELLQKTRNICNKDKLLSSKLVSSHETLISDDFKREVDNLIKNFKDNENLCKLTLPSGLNSMEMDYIKEVCIRENLFYSKFQKNYALNKSKEVSTDDIFGCESL